MPEHFTETILSPEVLVFATENAVSSPYHSIPSHPGTGGWAQELEDALGEPRCALWHAQSSFIPNCWVLPKAFCHFLATESGKHSGISDGTEKKIRGWLDSRFVFSMDQGQVFVFGFPDPTNLIMTMTMNIKEAIVSTDDYQGQPRTCQLPSPWGWMTALKTGCTRMLKRTRLRSHLTVHWWKWEIDTPIESEWTFMFIFVHNMHLLPLSHTLSLSLFLFR